MKFGNSLSPLGAQNKNLDAASQTLLTEVCDAGYTAEEAFYTQAFLRSFVQQGVRLSRLRMRNRCSRESLKAK